MQDLLLMSKDTVIARYEDDTLKVEDAALLPLYLVRTPDLAGWLSMRAIDEHRTNSRLLKRALRLEKKDDISTVLQVNAATITDTYWVKEPHSPLTYEDVRFKTNLFDNLALTGDPNSFNQKPSRTPELTNTGSFEKCWRLIDKVWWMYKAENVQERFTEVFAYHLAKALGIPAAIYETDNGYVRSRDFTDNARVNFEPAYSVIGEEADYVRIYDILAPYGEVVTDAFVQMAYFDALIFNMDRHEHNFGFLRDVETGAILGMAPLFDHNIALITRGYPKDVERRNDRLIADFTDLVKQRGIPFEIPELTEQTVSDAIANTGISLPKSDEINMTPAAYVCQFVLNGQKRIREQLQEIPREPVKAQAKKKSSPER